MACHTTFGTTELLEGILSFLPLLDLLQVQAVSKRWKDVITTSSSLQEKLFYRAEKPDRVWLVDVTNLPSGTKPLPRRYDAEVWVKASVSPTSEEMKSHYGLSVMPVLINPLCLYNDPPSSNGAPDEDAKYGTPVYLSRRFAYWEPGITPFYLSLDGSCQDMLLTQPPVEYVTIECFSSSYRDAGETDHDESVDDSFHEIKLAWKIFVKGGVRIGDILSEIKKTPGPIDAEDFQIHLHGAIVVTDEAENVIDERTKDWRNELAKLEEASTV